MSDRERLQLHREIAVFADAAEWGIACQQSISRLSEDEAERLLDQGCW